MHVLNNDPQGIIQLTLFSKKCLKLHSHIVTDITNINTSCFDETTRTKIDVKFYKHHKVTNLLPKSCPTNVTAIIAKN